VTEILRKLRNFQNLPGVFAIPCVSRLILEFPQKKEASYANQPKSWLFHQLLYYESGLNVHFSGGNFARLKDFGSKLLAGAANRENLVPTPPDIDHISRVLVEFTDGASMLGSSNVGCWAQIISEAFKSGASKLDRFWDVEGGEGKVHRAQVCLTQAEARELQELWPSLGDSNHVTMAQMRLIAQKYHKSTTIFHTNADGLETRIRASFDYVIGDVKSLCIHLGQDNKCPLCTVPYERMHCKLYAHRARDADFNKDEWQRSKVYLATSFAMGYASADFSKFLGSGDQCKTPEQLSTALAGLKGTTQLSVTLAEFKGLPCRFEGPGSVEERLHMFVEAYAGEFGLQEQDVGGAAGTGAGHNRAGGSGQMGQGAGDSGAGSSGGCQRGQRQLGGLSGNTVQREMYSGVGGSPGGNMGGTSQRGGDSRAGVSAGGGSRGMSQGRGNRGVSGREVGDSEETGQGGRDSEARGSGRRGSGGMGEGEGDSGAGSSGGGQRGRRQPGELSRDTLQRRSGSGVGAQRDRRQPQKPSPSGLRGADRNLVYS
jgi:hypothetical protein